MKIGFIQTGAIGDIVTAIPAARWYVDKGFDVYWPIAESYVSFFEKAVPYIHFLSVSQESNSYDFLLGIPKRLLNEYGVSEIFTLYVYLGSNDKKFEFGQPPYLSNSLKLDEYRYAITCVPFSEKWNLQIERDNVAENRILDAISAHIPYTIIHESPAGNRREIELQIPDEERARVVRVQNLTDSPFDWLTAFENAQIIATEDSLFANLVEQRNILTKKYLFLRSGCRDTPVFKNSWLFR
jgi:hypothetical protein